MPAQPEVTKSIIVTFKPKDKRADKEKDKTEIVRAAIKRSVSVFDARSVTPEALRGLDPAEIGYDINEYEAPIVTLQVTEKEAAALRKDPNVASVEDDGPMYALAMGYDTGALLFENQPAVQAETVPEGINQIKAPLAWDVTRGKGVKVAVLDTGIDFNHPDLASNYRGGASFVPDETSPMDYNSHGTHCAGIIAAALNGEGVVGVAPAAYLYAVKVLPRSGPGNWSWLIAGLDWCINNGTHIASMSLSGGPGPAPPTAVGTMCDLAFARGVLLVAAAGNNGPGPVEYPARYGSVIAVSAIDAANQLASFSCRGPEIELCARGVQVLSTVPGGGYDLKTGTSMACPHVTGAAALAWSTHRFPPAGLRRNVAIRRLLATTADNLGVPGRDNNFGFGRVDAEQAAFRFAVPPAVPGIP